MNNYIIRILPVLLVFGCAQQKSSPEHANYTVADKRMIETYDSIGSLNKDTVRAWIEEGKVSDEQVLALYNNYSVAELNQELNNREQGLFEKVNSESLLSDFSTESMLIVHEKKSKDMVEVLYGKNNIIDIADLKGRGISEKQQSLFKRNALGVLIVFDVFDTTRNSDNTFSFSAEKYKTLKESLKLCRNGAFWNQKCIGTATAFVIGTDTVVTAGHVLENVAYSNLCFMPYYTLQNSNENKFSMDKLYSAKQIIDSNTSTQNLDYAILKMDKQFSPDILIPMDFNAVYNEQDSFYVIGHPCGLPLKIATSAKYRNSITNRIRINSDTYHNNSGSPVFSYKTNKAIGILLRGEDDFTIRVIPNGTCNEYKILGENSGKGEDVLMLASIKDKLIFH